MAGTTKAILSSPLGADHFQRIASLHTDCTAEVLRAVIKTQLKTEKCTFKKFLRKPHVKDKMKELKEKRVLDQKQIDIIYSADLTNLDVTLSAVLLLNTFCLYGREKDVVLKLREKRNDLAHLKKGELPDDKLFKETSELILELCSLVDVELDIEKSILELEKRKLLVCCTNEELVKLKQEQLLFQLIDDSNKGTVVSTCKEWIIFGLTKWTDHLARGLQTDQFIKTLEEEKIISHKERQTIENHYVAQDKMTQLVLTMSAKQQETLLKVCKCLRQQNAILADLIENTNTGGKDIERALLDIECRRIKSVLREHLQRDVGKAIESEHLHIFVEEQLLLGMELNFKTIERCVPETFKDSSLNGCRFENLTWKKPSALTLPVEAEKQEKAEDMAKLISQLWQEACITVYQPLRNFLPNDSIVQR